VEEVAEVTEVSTVQDTQGWVLYKQCGESYSNNELGTCGGLSICDAGCAMSSVAMALSTFGHRINPGELNSWLRGHGGYAGGCSLYWVSVDAFGFSSFVGQERLSESQICSHIKKGDAVIANVRGGSHWVLLTGCRGRGVFDVNDPGFNQATYTLGDILTNSIYASKGHHAAPSPKHKSSPPHHKAPPPHHKAPPPHHKAPPPHHKAPPPHHKAPPHKKSHSPPHHKGSPPHHGGSGSCGGNCPGGHCPSCPCGTSPSRVDITSVCKRWSGWSQACCRCIATHESGGNAHALNYNTNGSFDVGLFQINQVNWGACNGGHPPCDVNSNLACAKKIFSYRRSFALWSTCSGCGCC